MLGLFLLPATLLAALLSPGASAEAGQRTEAGQGTETGSANSAIGAAGAPLVVIGSGGFTWADVTPEATPALWGLLRAGASATVSVRSVNPNTCPVDGWLSLSAGQRAAAPLGDKSLRPLTDGCPGIAPVRAGRVDGWDAYVAAAHSLRFDAEPGTLGDQLAATGVRAAAYGPGAALALARSDGRVEESHPVTDAAQGLPPGARVVVIDAGSVRDPADLGTGESAPGPSTAEQLRGIDHTVGTIAERLPPNATLIVAGLSDAGRSSRLRPIVARGDGVAPGHLYSPSTRQLGLTQSSDLTVTILRAAGASIPAGQGGKALDARADGGDSDAGAEDRRRHLVDLDQASHEIHDLVPPFFHGLVIAQLVIYLVVWRVWATRTGSDATRTRLVRWVRRIALAASAVPAASFLANLLPWWRADHPLPAIIGSVALFVALILAPAVLPPAGRRLLGPVAVVAAATVLVLAIDVMTGSRLQQSSLMGLQPVVGGRFYGMGNVTFSLFASATLMLAIALSHPLVRAGRRGGAAALVATVGLIAVVIDGNPAWGADGGGPPALLPGLAYLVLAILGLRMTWRRGLLTGAVTAGLFLLVAFLDSLRPPEKQSHLGRFFDALGSGGAWDIVVRKAEQNLGILFSNTLSLLVPFGLLFTILVLLRPTSWGSRALHASFERIPALRPGLIAWLIVMTIGFFINDSGVAIPAVGATVTIPLAIVIATHTLLRELAAGHEPVA